MTYSMLKDLQCIILRAISNMGSHFEVFESERLTLVCFRIFKHSDPVGNQRIVGLFSIISI